MFNTLTNVIWSDYFWNIKKSKLSSIINMFAYYAVDIQWTGSEVVFWKKRSKVNLIALICSMQIIETLLRNVASHLHTYHKVQKQIYVRILDWSKGYNLINNKQFYTFKQHVAKVTHVYINHAPWRLMNKRLMNTYIEIQKGFCFH